MSFRKILLYDEENKNTDIQIQKDQTDIDTTVHLLEDQKVLEAQNLPINENFFKFVEDIVIRTMQNQDKILKIDAKSGRKTKRKSKIRKKTQIIMKKQKKNIKDKKNMTSDNLISNWIY